MRQESDRYSCQIKLPGFGKSGQEALKKGRVLIVGLGGLGCPCAQYLAASGVGNLDLLDFDTISGTNLHRQILYSPEEIGLPKAEIAAKKLKIQNPEILIRHIIQKISQDNVLELLSHYDIVVDGTDNFETKYLLNDAAVLKKIPLVYGAIFQFEGQLSVFNVALGEGYYSPHYRDIFPEVNASQIPNCNDGGVLPMVAGILGCLQAGEVIKYLTGIGEILSGKILMIDMLTLYQRIIKIGNRSNSPVNGLTYHESANLMKVDDLKSALQESSVTLIDVRSLEERNQGHLGGIHIPLLNLEKELPLIKFSNPIVFYCATGRRSNEATKTAKKIYPDKSFFSLDGGFKAWNENLSPHSLEE